jgi:hypothetical protein
MVAVRCGARIQQIKNRTTRDGNAVSKPISNGNCTTSGSSRHTSNRRRQTTGLLESGGTKSAFLYIRVSPGLVQTAEKKLSISSVELAV